MSLRESFAADIEATAGEPIEAIVINEFGWDGYGSNGRDFTERKNELLSWNEARPLLDYEYYDGYGAPECHYFTAWSKSWVLFLHEHDGATSVERLSRNPEVMS